MQVDSISAANRGVRRKTLLWRGGGLFGYISVSKRSILLLALLSLKAWSMQGDADVLGADLGRVGVWTTTGRTCVLQSVTIVSPCKFLTAVSVVFVRYYCKQSNKARKKERVLLSTQSEGWKKQVWRKLKDQSRCFILVYRMTP